MKSKNSNYEYWGSIKWVHTKCMFYENIFPRYSCQVPNLISQPSTLYFCWPCISGISSGLGNLYGIAHAIQVHNSDITKYKKIWGNF